MSAKDKLEIGLKPDAPYRPDNLPESQQDDPEDAEARAQKPRADDDKTQMQRKQSRERRDANEPDEKVPDQ